MSTICLDYLTNVLILQREACVGNGGDVKAGGFVKRDQNERKPNRASNEGENTPSK